jgi:magnesium chelatase family protein
MIIEVPRQKVDKILSTTKEESSSQIREKVIKAWLIQRKRFENEDINFNSQMLSKHIQKYCPLSSSVKQLLSNASAKLSLSARSIHRIIKLARTLADLD